MDSNSSLNFLADCTLSHLASDNPASLCTKSLSENPLAFLSCNPKAPLALPSVGELLINKPVGVIDPPIALTSLTNV